MTLAIKNMVCDRCIRVVREELERLGFDVIRVTLGEAEIAGELGADDSSRVAARLEALGFELLCDRKIRIAEAVKNGIVELLCGAQTVPVVNLSDYLSRRLGLDYKYISALFSQTQGLTVEKYFIAQRIERVKELLAYDELTLSEIAFRLGFSSVAHLSAQFKRTTGLTPSRYKLAGCRRKPLDAL